MRRFRVALISTLLVCSVPGALYSLRSIESVASFENALRDNTLTAAFFYFKDENVENNARLHNYYKQDLARFEATEGLHEFVSFIKINTERDHLHEVAHYAGIRHTPTFALFYGRRKVATLEVKTGTITISRLQDFIFQHFKNHIDKKVKKEEERREQQKRAWLLRRPYYYGPYVYFGPHYGHYYWCPYHSGYHPYGRRCDYHYHGGFGFSFFLQ